MQSVSGDWSPVEVYVWIYGVHCPAVISYQRDWYYVSEGARTRTRSRDTGRSHVWIPLREISRSLLGSIKCPLGKYLRQVEATEASRKTDEVRTRQTVEGIITLKRGK